MATDLLNVDQINSKNNIDGIKEYLSPILRFGFEESVLTQNKLNGIKNIMRRNQSNLMQKHLVEIDEDDLHSLFYLYDSVFFANRINNYMNSNNYLFNLTASNRLKSYSGLFKVRIYRNTTKFSIEIAVKLINKQFKTDKSPVYVGGLECMDRIELLQRVLEHEISHLIEYIFFGETEDDSKRFNDILAKLWGHKESWHRLRL